MTRVTQMRPFPSPAHPPFSMQGIGNGEGNGVGSVGIKNGWMSGNNNVGECWVRCYLLRLLVHMWLPCRRPARTAHVPCCDALPARPACALHPA